MIKYILPFLISYTLFANVNVIEKNGLKYFSDVVVVKFRTEQRVLNKTVTNKIFSKQLSSFGVSEIVKHFNPSDKSKENTINKIYRLKINSPFNPIYVSAKLAKLPEVEWAEPLYLREIVYTPNDPKLSSQYGLTKVQAEAAWDISKGNSNIIVAIVDSGVDWNHEDLSANIWQNDDPINGVDDDNNGYIDDIRGWDFGGLDGTGDNDPIEDSPTHGTHVAGIASAVTNNSIGIAGLGYNITIMPVKTSRNDLGDRIIAYGYEGIIYAADNGADIINCSWGGFGFSNAEQEVINYAVAKGAVVVGAAGNDGLDDVIFPAAYKGVLSVGNTDENDRKSLFSNYGKGIDVMAPGSGINSTWQSSSTPYRYLSGTSMSSPLTAGLAGLVIDKFPSYTPLQIIEQIRVNSDNIDNQNPGKVDMLGSGRINAYKAVSNSEVKSVRILSSEFVETKNVDGIIEAGDEVEIKINFMNYLNPLTSFTAVLTTESSDVTISQSQFSTSAKGTLEEFNNINNKFKFKVNTNSANDKEVLFKLTYSDGSYSDFELISILINPTYRTQSGNNISFTITSKGTLAFNDYPGNEHGDGFTFMKGRNLLFEAGLMYGISETKLVNSVRDANPDSQSADFNPLSFVQIKNPGITADQEGTSIFNDDNAGNQKLSIETELRTYSFSDAGHDNYIVLKYIFKNKSGADYSNFYVGIYFDWDIDDEGYAENIIKFDSHNNFGYAYHTAIDKPFIGMALLTNGTTGYYGIRNDGTDGGVGVYEGFSDASKWLTLTNGLNKTDAGPADVSSVISAGPFEIKADSTLVVAFSLSSGIDLNSIQNSVANSRVKYNSILTNILDEESELPTEFSLSQNYPNPFNPSTTIKYSIPVGVTFNTTTKLIVYDILGREVATLVNQNQKAGNYEMKFSANAFAGGELTSGIYFYRLTSGSFAATKKLMLLK
ncbi:MAG: S8 family serine peptidase [Melioribacteraceae bacterium]|nr:S8 family serine peptidase [Melioribacteraceae bacterium]